MPAFQYQLSNRIGPVTVEDYRRLARRAVPDMAWAYLDYGAEDMATMQANRSAFARYAFKRKVLTGNEASDLSTTIGGQQVALPVILAPTGTVGLQHWEGERGVAQAAERAGTLSIVSTVGSYSFEEVAEATERDHYFQLYPWRDTASGRHDVTLSLIKRAQDAGYKAMFVTVDVPVIGNRQTERQRGLGNPPIITPLRVLNGALKPRWWIKFLQHQRIASPNVIDNRRGAAAAVAALRKTYTMMRPELTWDDFAIMRDAWDGPVYIKGVLDAEDAVKAVDLGATGVVVSNHGGRQLDGDVAGLDALPAIAAAVGSRAEVLLDGGVRRGSDVVKALCLGADAVLIGRPYLYGMAARGPAGVEHVIEIFTQEIRRTMTLMGVGRLSDLGPDWLLPANTPVPFDRPEPSSERKPSS